MAQDFYKTLNVDRGASPEEIKKAYRKLAIELHPDKNKDKSPEEQKQSEAKFKEVAEAYDTLSDASKRSHYDQFGSSKGGFDFSKFQRGNPFADLFQDMMGGGSPFFGGGFDFGRPRQEVQRKGTTVRISVNLTVDDLEKRPTKEYNINLKRPCPKCDGGTKTTCPYCNGKGMITQQIMQGFAHFVSTQPCNHCEGSGYIIKNDCTHCSGTGLVDVQEKISVPIPMGVTVGSSFALIGKGNSVPKVFGNLNGDIHVVVSDIDAGDYQIDGYNLIKEVRVPIIDILLGCEVPISVREGIKHVHIPNNTKDGAELRLRNHGLPDEQGYHGDIRLFIRHVFPTELSEKEIGLLKEFKDERGSV